MAETVLRYMALAVAYSLLAAAVLEGLIALWGIRDPSLAIRLRLLVLSIPPVAPLLFAALALNPGPELFRRQQALLHMENWLGPTPTPSHPGWVLLLAALAGTGLLVVGMEIGGLLHRLRQTPAMDHTPQPLPEKLREALAGLQSRGVRPPRVLLSGGSGLSAWAAGNREPAVWVSAPLVELLDREELEGVLAHEVAHIHRRDSRLGWLAFGLRLVSFYNPVALFTFHRISLDVERVCDAEAARSSGRGMALASALIKVYLATRPAERQGPGWPHRLQGRAVALENRARRTLVEDRAERLLRPEAGPRATLPGLRLATAAAAVLLLTWMVV